MRDWHHDWKTDVGLRLCGLTSSGASYLAIRTLMALRLPDGQLPQTALPFLLAALGFLCASAGGGLLCLGHHIFDEVEISRRWWTTPPRPDEVARSTAQIDFKSADDPYLCRAVGNPDNADEFDNVRRA